MGSRVLAFGLIAILAGCGGGGGKYALRNMDDACSIARQKPNYFKAMRSTERKWGVPIAVQMATIWQESRFKGNARTPVQYSAGVVPVGRQSSAYGFAQVLDDTWNEYKAETGRWGARRDDIRDATDFIGWYMSQTQQKVGVATTDTKNQYLAYHEGQAGFARGTHNRKRWLLSVANDVSSRAVTYDYQLRSCGLI